MTNEKNFCNLRNSYYYLPDELPFEEAIAYVLRKISIPRQDREMLFLDARLIEKAVMAVIMKFNWSFQGLIFTCSFSDGIRIHLPDKFDTYVKLNLPYKLQPAALELNPTFVKLRVIGHKNNIRDSLTDHSGQYIDLKRLNEYCQYIFSTMIPKNVRVSRRRSYNLTYTKDGVAHTLVATENRNSGRKICFDFLTVFEFEANDWPLAIKRTILNVGRTWLAVPCNYFRDVSFRAYTEHKNLTETQNLKDSLRLLNVVCNFNEMHQLHSFINKSLYLNKTLSRGTAPDQSAGCNLIRMLHALMNALEKGWQSFALVPEINNLASLNESTKFHYLKKVRRILKLLIRRRNSNYMTYDDLYNIFGIN